jgi:hypothetical protein
MPMVDNHWLRTVHGYVENQNRSRTDPRLGGNSTISRLTEVAGEVVAAPVLGGRHHRVTRVSYDQHAGTPSASGAARLRQDVPGYITVHIGQAEISAGVVVGEAFVVEAHEVQDGGVPIVDG